MFTYHIEIKKDTSMILNNQIFAIKNYLHEMFYKEISEPNYFLGYITDLVEIEIQHSDKNDSIIGYIYYTLKEDKQFNIIKERLQIGL
jgi:isoprenylcysteine carboxyl methyltransferase (ICMT) family protein YpbQ